MNRDIFDVDPVVSTILGFRVHDGPIDSNVFSCLAVVVDEFTIAVIGIALNPDRIVLVFAMLLDTEAEFDSGFTFCIDFVVNFSTDVTLCNENEYVFEK